MTTTISVQVKWLFVINVFGKLGKEAIHEAMRKANNAVGNAIAEAGGVMCDSDIGVVAIAHTTTGAPVDRDDGVVAVLDDSGLADYLERAIGNEVCGCPRCEKIREEYSRSPGNMRWLIEWLRSEPALRGDPPSEGARGLLEWLHSGFEFMWDFPSSTPRTAFFGGEPPDARLN